VKIPKAKFRRLRLPLFGAIFVCLAGSLLAVGFNPPYWVYPTIAGMAAVFFLVRTLREFRIVFRSRGKWQRN
jgi:hypothetical protein